MLSLAGCMAVDSSAEAVTLARERTNISNWAGNVGFQAIEILPESEAHLRDVLDEFAGTCVRVGGTLHSFNGACKTDNVLLRMDNFKKMQLEPDGYSVRVGAGIMAKTLDGFLKEYKLTLPVPLTTATQNVVGMISHATRGAGANCLGAYVEEVRITSRSGGAATTQAICGQELQVAAVSLGLLGVVTEVVLRVVPDYLIKEVVTCKNTCEEAVAAMMEKPMTYAIILPYAWEYTLLERRVVEGTDANVSSTSACQRMNLGRVLAANLMAEIDRCTGCSLRILDHLSNFIRETQEGSTITARASDVCQNAWVNNMVSNVQFEALMPVEQMPNAVALFRLVLEVFAGTAGYDDPKQPWAQRLAIAGLWKPLVRHWGTMTFNVASYMRLTRPDNSNVMSPTYLGPGIADDRWYCCLNVEYYTPGRFEEFQSMASVLLTLLLEFCDARLHWGKYFPLDTELMRKNLERHAGLEQFFKARESYDPEGQFLNEHYKVALGLQEDVDVSSCSQSSRDTSCDELASDSQELGREHGHWGTMTCHV